MNKKASVPATQKKRKRRSASLDVRKARAGWIFVLPFVLGFLLIYLPIIYDSIKFTFNNVLTVRGGGYELEYIGFSNYHEALFIDPDFVTTLVSGMKQLIFDIPAIVVFSLFIALLLNQKMAGRAAFRAIFFIPVILSTGLIANIDASNAYMDYQGGATGSGEDTQIGVDDGTGAQSGVSQIISVMDVEKLFANMMVGTELVAYVVQMVNNIFNIVNRSGVQMLIFLAGLQSISPAIYESCSIDGASAWETFWKITLPMVSPMILVNTIYTVIDSFTSESNTVMKFIAQVYDRPGDQTLSSAMAWMYFLIVIVVIALVAAIVGSFVFYQRRD